MATTSTYTLINAAAHRKIIFTGREVAQDVIEVDLAAEGPNGGAWNYVLRKGEHKDFDNQPGAFILRGTLSWPEPYNAIRFTGDLVLINWAQVHMDNCPVLVSPF
jgi:hypothetical protein